MIALIGPRGVGKSTVGKLLARFLSVPFVDLDDVVEGLLGASARVVFAERGEAAWRAGELLGLSSIPGEECVVALGAGALGPVDFRAELERRKAVVVLLEAAPATTALRVMGDPLTPERRPFLRTMDAYQEARELLAERGGQWIASAHHRVDATRLDPWSLAEEIAERLWVR